MDNPSWQGYELCRLPGGSRECVALNRNIMSAMNSGLMNSRRFVDSCNSGHLAEGSSSVVDGYRVDYIIEQMRESGRRNGETVELHYIY